MEGGGAHLGSSLPVSAFIRRRSFSCAGGHLRSQASFSSVGGHLRWWVVVPLVGSCHLYGVVVGRCHRRQSCRWWGAVVGCWWGVVVGSWCVVVGSWWGVVASHWCVVVAGPCGCSWWSSRVWRRCCGSVEAPGGTCNRCSFLLSC